MKVSAGVDMGGIRIKIGLVKNEKILTEAVVGIAVEQPAYGQFRVSNELKKKGLFISPGGVRSV